MGRRNPKRKRKKVSRPKSPPAKLTSQPKAPKESFSRIFNFAKGAFAILITAVTLVGSWLGVRPNITVTPETLEHVPGFESGPLLTISNIGQIPAENLTFYCKSTFMFVKRRDGPAQAIFFNDAGQAPGNGIPPLASLSPQQKTTRSCMPVAGTDSDPLGGYEKFAVSYGTPLPLTTTTKTFYFAGRPEPNGALKWVQVTEVPPYVQ